MTRQARQVVYPGIVGGALALLLLAGGMAIRREPSRRAEAHPSSPENLPRLSEATTVRPSSRETRASDPTPQTPAPPEADTLESIFEQARAKAEKDQDYGAAIARYKRVFARETESREMAACALFEIGVCLEKMGKQENAREAFLMFLERYPKMKELREKAHETVGRGIEDTASGREEMLEKMHDMHVHIALRDVTLQELMDELRGQTRINIIIDENEPLSEPPVRESFLLGETDAQTTFEAALKAYAAAWRLEQGVILVSPKGCTWGHDQWLATPPELPPWEEDDPRWKVDQQAMQRRLHGVTLDFTWSKTPFEEGLHEISAQSGVAIVMDRHVEDQFTGGRVPPMEGWSGKGFPVDSLMPLLVRQYGLDWYVENDVIHVTTRAQAEAYRAAHR